MDRRILFLKNKISDDLKANYSLEELAESVRLSPSHLHRLFKSETGMTPAHLICELRMEKAHKLLQDTFKTVKEICFEVGISNQSVFTRRFKEKYGITPTGFRKQLD